MFALYATLLVQHAMEAQVQIVLLVTGREIITMENAKIIVRITIMLITIYAPFVIPVVQIAAGV